VFSDSDDDDDDSDDDNDDPVAEGAAAFPPPATHVVHKQVTRSDVLCSICLDCMPADSEMSNVAVMGCAHRMHMCCFVKHVRNLPKTADVSCPLCRAVQPTEAEMPEAELPESPEKRQRV
jgi:hypothetical protein